METHLSARALAEADPGPSLSGRWVLLVALLATVIGSVLVALGSASDVQVLEIQFAAIGYSAEPIVTAWVDVTGSIAGLGNATPGAVAQAVIDAWRLQGSIPETVFLLALDVVFLIAYGFAVFHLCRWVANGAQSKYTKAAFYWLARGAVVAALADLLENVGTGAMIYFGASDWLAIATTTLAISKWLLIVPATVGALLQAAFNRLRSGSRGRFRALPQPFVIPQQSDFSKRVEPLAPDSGRVGIASSGGGIRSAAYNLGALQALQRRSLNGSPSTPQDSVYGKAHTHAAVSGGSYIAAALRILAETSDGPLGDIKEPYRRLSPEERYLRLRTSYLAPRFRDKLALTVQLLLGALSGLILVAGVLVVLARPIGWLAGIEWLHPEPGTGGLNVVIRDAHWQVALAPLVFVLVANVLRSLSGETAFGRGIAKWVMPFQTHWLMVSMMAFLVAIIIPATPLFVQWLKETIIDIASRDPDSSTLGQALSSGNVIAIASALGIVGWVVSIVQPLLKRPGTIPRLANTIAAVIAPTALLIGGLSIAVRGHHLGPTGHPRALWLWDLGPDALLIALIAVVLALAFLGLDVTDWAFHRFYRDRLASTFGLVRTNSSDEPLRSDVPRLSELEGNPELAICAAANIAGGTWTLVGRRAVSFVFDSKQVGIPDHCTVPTIKMEKAMEHRSQPLDVMTAVAISGAAVSPGMGKRTNRSLTALLTLAGIRLGVWVPNPVWLRVNDPEAERSPWREKVRLSYFFKEMFGLFRYNDRYLYVTDGGHWDNLGLVELLRRGCTTIYVLDASGDSIETFNTLGESLAYARADLGVAVEIKPEEMRPKTEKSLNPKKLLQRPNLAPTDHVAGRIRYLNHETGEVAEGYIVVSKATVIEKTPWAVKSYHERFPRFPNHSTTDQLFDGDRFDAYQALGEFTAERAIRDLALYAAHETAWWDRAQRVALGERDRWPRYLEREVAEDLDRLDAEQTQYLRALFKIAHENNPASIRDLVETNAPVRDWVQQASVAESEAILDTVRDMGRIIN